MTRTNFGKLHKRLNYHWHRFSFDFESTRERWIVHKWCVHNTRGKWSYHLDSFYIQEDRDAMMFKLAWAEAQHRKRR